METPDITTAVQTYKKILGNIENAIQGQSATIRKLLAAFAAGGHILLEDLPGTGKTTLAKALSQSVSLQFQRVQFTPDLLPSDILGVSIFDQQKQEFRLHKGPVFTEVLLADEINRASPRVQSALLESMEERQVSLEGERHTLGDLFFVIATQNPVESHGTYPLPEAQLDRFALRLSLGYVSAEQEVKILTRRHEEQSGKTLQACVNKQEFEQLKQSIRQVRLSVELKYYIVELVRTTRKMPEVQMGASTRAALSLMQTAQALALFDGEDFVSPEHIQEIAVQVIAHRLKMNSQAHFSGHSAEESVREIMRHVKVPV